MSYSRHTAVCALFDAVRSLEPAARVALLDRECSNDAALRAEVESLLAEHDRTSGLLGVPALGVGFSIERGASEPSMPRTIASFRVLDVLGRGGMGLVYRAEQDQPRREVALKVLPPELASPARCKRFTFEAEVLARLQHPCIAQIHAAGIADGEHGAQPYFAMELIRGTTLSDYARAQRLDTRAKLALLARIAHAVQYAHEHGVIHRDLKPGNILVDAAGTPKILDFGIARTIDADLEATRSQTATGEIVGTLPYMSPEQVSGASEALDARCDVYALGVVGYELLCGRLPLDTRDVPLIEALRTIREVDPPRLSTWDRTLRGDVETIFAHALEKDRAQRYATARELAEDLERCLRDEPIRARPASRLYQLAKFTRRNRVLVGGIAATIAALVTGIVTTSVQAANAREERNRAVELGQEKARETDKALAALETSRREAALRKESFEFIAAVLLSANPDVQGADVKVADILDSAGEYLDGGAVSDPGVQALLRTTIGWAFLNLGAWPKAVEHLRIGARLSREHLGARDGTTLFALQGLGRSLNYLDRLDEARPLLEEHLALVREAHGPQHADTLNAERELAYLLQRQGRLEDARARYERLLETEKSLGDERREYALNVANFLGDVLRELQRPEAAAAVLTWAIEECERRPVQDQSLLESLWSTLAGVRLLEEDYAGAAATLEKVLEHHRATYGEEDPRTLLASINLGFALANSGELDRAGDLQEQALEHMRRSLGDAHSFALKTLANLVDLRRRQGRPEQALAHLASLVEIVGRPEVADSSDLMNIRFFALEQLMREKRWAEAEPLARRNLDAARASLPAGDWRVPRYAALCGSVLAELGALDDAEALLLEGYDGLKRALGSEDARTCDAVRGLIRLCDRRGDADGAERYRALLPANE